MVKTGSSSQQRRDADRPAKTKNQLLAEIQAERVKKMGTIGALLKKIHELKEQERQLTKT